MRIRALWFLGVMALTGCATTDPAERLLTRARAAKHEFTSRSAAAIAGPPSQEVMRSQIRAQQAAPSPSIQAPRPASPSTTPPSAESIRRRASKYKVFAAEMRLDEKEASRLAQVDGLQSRDLHKETASAGIARLACRDTRESPDERYFSSVIIFGVQPEIIGKGVVRINHEFFRVTEENVVARRGNLADLKFAVRMCNGRGTLAMPSEEIEKGWWGKAGSTMWWGVPPAFREYVTYPYDDTLRTCSGRGDDQSLCGRHEVDPQGEYFSKLNLDTVSVFTFRATLPNK